MLGAPQEKTSHKARFLTDIRYKEDCLYRWQGRPEPALLSDKARGFDQTYNTPRFTA